MDRKTYMTTYMKTYRIQNKSRVLGHERTYRLAHKDVIKGRNHDQYMKNRATLLKGKVDYHKKYHAKVRLEVLIHYSRNPPLCSCCGEKMIKFLTIDHINGNGCKERKATKHFGSGFYVWLRKNSYPEGYRVLCYNCNCGRARNNGICPHQEI